MATQYMKVSAVLNQMYDAICMFTDASFYKGYRVFP